MNEIIGILIVGSIGFGIPMLLILGKLSKNKKVGLDNYKPTPFKKIISTEFDEKFRRQGTDVKNGTLMIGFNKIKHVNKFFETVEKFPVYDYDAEKGMYVQATYGNDDKESGAKKGDPVEPVEGDLTIFRVGSPKRIFRILNLNHSYYIVNTRMSGCNLTYTPENDTWQLPSGFDFYRYAGVWINNPFVAEYVNNIGVMELNHTIMTHILNYPEKVILLEADQSKGERNLKMMASLENAKYENIKRAGDTGMT